MAAVVLWGYRMWPGVAIGAFLANSWTGVPLYAVLGITAGNTLEALVGAYLLNRFAGFRPSLERVRDVLSLVALGAVVSTAVSASFGVTSLLAGHEIAAGDYGLTWRTWWLGDMGGDLVVAPALMVAATHWPFRLVRDRLLEAVAVGLVILGVAGLVFSQGAGLVYPIFPPLIWAALRFRQTGAVIATLLIAAVAVPLTENNIGAFSGNSPDDRLLLAQTFVGIAGITALILAAVTSERRRVEEIVEYIAETLQESLRPSHLPEIPGIETAIDFHAAGERHLVGGDFYDLFANGDRSWSVIVGDVRGKGATAAATTALARYTLRAAAAEEDRPSRVLQKLNEAIRSQSPGESCTVAYARVDLDHDPAARLTLSLAGHPLPLALGADGTVEPVGDPGTLLGMFPRPRLTDYPAKLAPGDALLVYTDGLTDAHAPRRIVRQEELMRALGSCAGRSASEIARGVQRAVLGPSPEPRDDVVVLVLRMAPSPEGVTAAVR